MRHAHNAPQRSSIAAATAHAHAARAALSMRRGARRNTPYAPSESPFGDHTLTCSSVTKRSSAHAAISQTCCHPQFHDRMDVSGRTCRRRDAHASTLDAPEQPRNRWHAVTHASPHAWPGPAPHARCQARALGVVSSITQKKKKKLSGGARPMRGAVDRPSAAYQCVLPCMLRMAALVAIAGRQLVVCSTDVHAAAARRTASTATRRCSERRAKLVIDRPSLV